MSPTTSSLLLKDYFVEELFCKANEKFDPSRQRAVGIEDLTIIADARASKKKSEGWQVRLVVFHQTEDGSNSPYSFRISLVGFFNVDDKYPAANAEWLIKTNAPSVLYSAAREIIRRTTQDGPWLGVLLPTASFYTDELKALIARKKHKRAHS